MCPYHLSLSLCLVPLNPKSFVFGQVGAEIPTLVSSERVSVFIPWAISPVLQLSFLTNGEANSASLGLTEFTVMKKNII